MASQNVHNEITKLKLFWYICHNYFNMFNLLRCFIFASQTIHGMIDKVVKGQPIWYCGFLASPAAAWNDYWLHQNIFSRDVSYLMNRCSAGHLVVLDRGTFVISEVILVLPSHCMLCVYKLLNLVTYHKKKYWWTCHSWKETSSWGRGDGRRKGKEKGDWSTSS